MCPQSAEGTGEEIVTRSDEGKGRGGIAPDSYDELFENFSPVNSPDHLFDLSDEELGVTKRVSFSWMGLFYFLGGGKNCWLLEGLMLGRGGH